MNGMAGEHFKFVSQKDDVGVEHNVISGLGSDGPSSCMDIDELQIGDTIEANVSYKKGSNRRVDETQRSGGST